MSQFSEVTLSSDDENPEPDNRCFTHLKQQNTKVWKVCKLGATQNVEISRPFKSRNNSKKNVRESKERRQVLPTINREGPSSDLKIIAAYTLNKDIKGILSKTNGKTLVTTGKSTQLPNAPPPVIELDDSTPSTSIHRTHSVITNGDSPSGKFNKKEPDASSSSKNLPKMSIETNQECTKNITAKETTNNKTETTIRNEEIFEKFLKKCFELESIEEDRLKAREKLKKSYERLEPKFLSSKDFFDLVERQLKELTTERLYFCIKDILDEFKSHRHLRRVVPVACGKTNSGDCDNIPRDSGEPQLSVANSVEETSLDTYKNDAIIQKLTRTLEKLSRKIKRLEEAEVNWDDEENSHYLRLTRYEQRFVHVHTKLCEYTGDSIHAGRISKKKIKFSATKYPEVNAIVESWINKTKTFPDFRQMVQLLEQNLDSSALKINPEGLKTIAAEAFRELGKLLQKRRRQDSWDSLASFGFPFEEDPAIIDPQLDAKLKENAVIFARKEKEIIDTYVEKQTASKLEAEDVSDNATQESDVSKGEGEDVDLTDASLSLDEGSQGEPEERNCNVRTKEDASGQSNVDLEINAKQEGSNGIEVAVEMDMGSGLNLAECNSTKRKARKRKLIDLESENDENDCVVVLDNGTRRVSSDCEVVDVVELEKGPVVVEINAMEITSLPSKPFSTFFQRKHSVLRDFKNILPLGVHSKLKRRSLQEGLPNKCIDSYSRFFLGREGPCFKSHGTVMNGDSSDNHDGSYKTVGEEKPKDLAPSGDSEVNESLGSGYGAGGGEDPGDKDKKDKTSHIDKDDEEDELEEADEEESDPSLEHNYQEKEVDERSEGLQSDVEDRSEKDYVSCQNDENALLEHHNEESMQIEQNEEQEGDINQASCENEDTECLLQTDSLQSDCEQREVEEEYGENQPGNLNSTSPDDESGECLVSPDSPGRGFDHREGECEKHSDYEERSNENEIDEVGKDGEGNVNVGEATISETSNEKQGGDVLMQTEETVLNNEDLKINENESTSETDKSQKIFMKQKTNVKKPTKSAESSVDSSEKLNEVTKNSFDDDTDDTSTISDKDDNDPLASDNESGKGTEKVQSEKTNEELKIGLNNFPKKPDEIIEAYRKPERATSSLRKKILVKTSSMVKGGKSKRLTKNADAGSSSVSADPPKDIKVPSNVRDLQVISERFPPKVNRRSSDITADERVKRFLQNADSSLSITVKRHRPMSQETQEALAHLKTLKNISATRVPRAEPDVMVIGERALPRPVPSPGASPRPRPGSSSRQTPPFHPRIPNQRFTRVATIRPTIRPATLPHRYPRFPSSPQPNGLPFISSVQSCNNATTPVILSVRGGIPRFRGSRPSNGGTPTSAGRSVPRKKEPSSVRNVPYVVLD